MTRFLALAFVAALALTGCDAAGDSPSALGADAPLGGESMTTHSILPAEKALNASTLQETLLSDMPLADALLGAGAAFEFRSRGAVFVLSNDAANSVIAFARGKDGTLSEFGTFPTGGAGAPELGASTNPLVIGGHRGKYLYAVNGGSDEISTFRIDGDGLEAYGNVASGGALPLSIAASGNRLYVLNAGRDGAGANVTGFEIRPNGRLRALGMTAALPADFAAPPQIGFDPSGQTVTVTDRASSQIAVYAVAADGTLGTPEVTASEGVTPFGFDHDVSGRLFVTEANAASGPVADGSSVSSYSQSGTSLSTISSVVPTTETAACWARVIGSYVYVTNTGSGTISGYRIGEDGSLSLLDADGITATTASNPRDMNIALRYLYAQSDGQIDAYRIGEDGSLTSIGTVSVPMTARGVATR